MSALKLEIPGRFPEWALENPALIAYRRLLADLRTARYMYDALDTRPTKPYYLVATGKAAISMATAVVSRWGPPVAGLVVTKGATSSELPDGVRVITGGHPFPTEASLVAGDAVIKFCESIPAHSTVIYLLSGGSSALVEKLVDGVSLDQLRQDTKALLESGETIDRINDYRKSVSLVKGGRLAERLAGSEVRVFVLSDVPGDDLSVVGSGPLFPFFPHTLVANQSYAIDSLTRQLESLGLRVVIGPTLTGELMEISDRYTSLIRTLPIGTALLGSGESTLRITGSGVGGRCQHFALQAAIQLEHVPGVSLLSGSTDGTDGPTDIAGAIIDNHTLARAKPLDPKKYLANFNSNTYLDAADALIVTGDTQSNINDVVIAVHL
jgi:hydroxypyruvate reductase